MLVSSMIQIGMPIAESSCLSAKERVKWLSDIESDTCKNYFRNVFLVEVGETKTALQYMQVGKVDPEDQKKFIVDHLSRSSAFPVIFPQGGNPIKAQGVYPAPCYLMYEAHINGMTKIEEFREKTLMPRLKRTLTFRDWKEEELQQLAQRVCETLVQNAGAYITEEKQLGILALVNSDWKGHLLLDESKSGEKNLIRVAESKLHPGRYYYLQGEALLESLLEARLEEAATLGKQKKAISTFSHQSEEVVSIYNKSWPWLSSTWDAPKSIYWEEKDWTPGIKIDRKHYEAFLYASQFLKRIQVPISNPILKEMFAPADRPEAKRNIKPTSYETIYGIPIVLPLLDDLPSVRYQKYERMMKKEAKGKTLHLEVLAGMKESMVPEMSDHYRLTILYYSGDMTKGAIHIRAILEDIIPSVAHRIQDILAELNQKELSAIQDAFGLDKKPMYRTENLPSLLGNAYGSSYLWNALQDTLHRNPLSQRQALRLTVKKLNELANQNADWEMKQELTFLLSFQYFLSEYQNMLNISEKEEVNLLSQWKNRLSQYQKGSIDESELQTPQQTGFTTGLFLKQFGNAYYRKTGKDFVKTRVMTFGSRLTPEVIWKNGLLKCEELTGKWDLKHAANYWSVLPPLLLAFIDQEPEKNWKQKEKDLFMTAFWAGYHMYQKPEENDEENQNQGGEKNEYS
ncbi:hypothetical protein [Tindallia californiensis]|uniref:Uncharacterized protein n=1 Tax=Tindallia californiensis TaxID=159292 RepID=A0A1H3PQ95_9FIRM|nr:hypothetical protein [Tindallia californiensis]SDZ03247.1 hypothetical protein SAMN05192546_10725 [Tindallia californiensis]